MRGKYGPFDPFIFPQNVRQVYYVPYPSTRTDKRGWCVAIKTKPRGCIEADDVEEEVAYQVDEMSQVNDVNEVEPIVCLRDEQFIGEEVDDGDDELDHEEALDEPLQSEDNSEAEWPDNISISD